MKTTRKILAIFSILIYVCYTAFLIYLIIDGQTNVPAEGEVDCSGFGNAIAFIVFVLIFGTIAYVINTIVSISGWLITNKLNEENQFLSNTLFKVMSFLPSITLTIFIIIYIFILK